MKFDVLYVDCPWRFRQINGLYGTGAAAHEYPVLDFNELCDLRMDDVTTPDSTIFLWVPWSMLPEGLALMTAWGFCCRTGTRILTADLQWKPAELLNVGDKLVGFDDLRTGDRGGSFDRRYFQWATVLSTGKEYQQCYEVTLVDGTEIVCTGNHKWLAKIGAKDYAVGFNWHTTEDLYRRDQRKLPTQFWRLMPVAEPDYSYTSGLLAGAFDGEGNLRANNTSWGIQFAQRDNDFLAAVESGLTEKGYKFSRYAYPAYSKRCVTIKGKRSEAVRLLMQCRPPRLLKNWLKQDISKQSLYDFPQVEVKHIRFVGVNPVVTLMTDTGTYIAEGFGAHNTFKTVAFNWIKGRTTPHFDSDGIDYATLDLRMGMGSWTRMESEPCLLGVKGHPKRASAGVRQVVLAPMLGHSAKPPEVADRIVQLVGDVPRLEVFARPPVKAGWTAIGDQIDGLDVREALDNYINGFSDDPSDGLSDPQPNPLLGEPSIRNGLLGPVSPVQHQSSGPDASSSPRFDFPLIKREDFDTRWNTDGYTIDSTDTYVDGEK